MKHCLIHFGRVWALALMFAVGQVSLLAQPSNDLFANSITLTGTNFTVFGNNTGATREPGEPYTAGAPGGQSVWWSWTAPYSGQVTISTDGSDFDTVLGVYTGDLVWELSPIVDNDDEVYGVVTNSKVQFVADGGQTYRIAVDGYDSTQFGNIQLNLRLLPLQQAPAWQLFDPYGGIVNSTNFAGKVVMINFWATWCSPCVGELPGLAAMQAKYGSDGFQVVGVDLGELVSTVTNFLATNTAGINYPIVFGNSLATAYGGVPFYPTSYLIDRNNFVVKQFTGSLAAPYLETQIIPLLYDNVRLTSQRNGNQLKLLWPTNAGASASTFILESSTSLRNPAWVQWPTSPTLVNGFETVQIPLTATNRYFHLRLVMY